MSMQGQLGCFALSTPCFYKNEHIVL